MLSLSKYNIHAILEELSLRNFKKPVENSSVERERHGRYGHDQKIRQTGMEFNENLFTNLNEPCHDLSAIKHKGKHTNR